VRALRYFAEAAPSYCIAASVRRQHQPGFDIILYRADGSDGCDPENDLYHVADETRVVYWVNLYPGGAAAWHESAAEADTAESRRSRAGALPFPGRLHGAAMRVEVVHEVVSR
jgi:hypothetical protein